MNLVSEVVEEVIGLDCLLAALLVAEYEVDPLVQVRAHMIALEGLAVLADEVLRRVGPRRQHYVVHTLVAGLTKPQIQIIVVAKKLSLHKSNG